MEIGLHRSRKIPSSLLFNKGPRITDIDCAQQFRWLPLYPSTQSISTSGSMKIDDASLLITNLDEVNGPRSLCFFETSNDFSTLDGIENIFIHLHSAEIDAQYEARIHYPKSKDFPLNREGIWAILTENPIMSKRHILRGALCHVARGSLPLEELNQYDRRNQHTKDYAGRYFSPLTLTQTSSTAATTSNILLRGTEIPRWNLQLKSSKSYLCMSCRQSWSY